MKTSFHNGMDGAKTAPFYEKLNTASHKPHYIQAEGKFLSKRLTHDLKLYDSFPLYCPSFWDIEGYP
jgi:hypothetical protein